MCPKSNQVVITTYRASAALCLAAIYLSRGYTVRNIKIVGFWLIKRYCVTMTRETSVQPFLDFTIGPVGDRA